jgi:hypothetical protein
LLFVYTLDIMAPLALPLSTPPPRRGRCRLSQDHGPRVTKSFFPIRTRHSSLATRHCLLSPLESAFTHCDALTPLESALTQTTGGGGGPLFFSWVAFSCALLRFFAPSHLTTPFFSAASALFCKNTRGGGVPFLSTATPSPRTPELRGTTVC